MEATKKREVGVANMKSIREVERLTQDQGVHVE
jgi:hypothetical protein